MALDLDTTCRACLSVGIPATSHSLLEPEARELFQNCTLIEIEDGFPSQMICDACYDQCQSFNHFRAVCRENDQHLKSIVQERRLDIVEITVEEAEEESLTEILPAPEVATEVTLQNDDPKTASSRKQIVNWACLNCDATFRVNLDFRTHLKENHLEKRTCPICSDTFRTIDKAIDHYVEVHVKRFACAGCPKRFKTQNSLVIHIRKEHDADPSLLFVVGPRIKRLRAKPAVKKNQTRTKVLNKTEGHIKCGFCEYTVDKVMGFESHFRWKHGTSLTCEVCQERTTNNQEHLNHVYMKHMNCQFQCNSCSFTSASPLVIKKHQYEDHSIKKARMENYICAVCGKTFPSLHSLNVHSDFHTEGTPCKVCNKNVKGASAMNSHMKRHTEERNYHCDICAKSYKTHDDLKAHRRRHFEEERKFACETCGAKFFTVCNLKDHRVTHTGARNYKCPLCEKAYTTSSDLKTHSRVHTGERPFACQLCPDRFSRRTSLKQHARVHNKNK